MHKLKSVSNQLGKNVSVTVHLPKRTAHPLKDAGVGSGSLILVLYALLEPKISELLPQFARLNLNISLSVMTR